MKRGNRKNYKGIVALVAVIAYSFSKYLPWWGTSVVLVVVACTLIYGAIDSRIKNDSYLYTGMYISFSVAALTGACIKFLEINTFDYYRYSRILWQILIVSAVSTLILGFAGGLKHGEEEKRKQVKSAIIILGISALIILILKMIG